jgi:catalase
MRTSPFDKPPWRTIHATAAGTLGRDDATEKVRFAKDARNNGYAVAGKRRAADAVHDIRGFALRLAEEGDRDVVGSNPPPIVDGRHDELSARSMR